MIPRAVMFIILWTLPWNPAYRLNLRSIDFTFECNDYLILAGYARAENTILICSDGIMDGARTLKDMIIHESQHHMQWTECPACESGGWAEFERVAVVVTKKGDYTDHQRNSVYALVGFQAVEPWYNELHAELPTILGLDIPKPLQRWYPWLNTE